MLNGYCLGERELLVRRLERHRNVGPFPSARAVRRIQCLGSRQHRRCSPVASATELLPESPRGSSVVVIDLVGCLHC